MALCHITGTLFIPDGSEASNRRIQFQKLATDVVTDDYAGAVVPEVIPTKTDANGDVDVYLVTGYYVGTVLDRRGNRSYTFKATVPEQSTANIADLIAASDPVEPLPAWLQEAWAARDAAEAEADRAEAAAADAEGFADAAADSADDAQDSADAAAASAASLLGLPLVRYDAQALTAGERDQVKANIEAVSYAVQTLTTAQQTQAQTNIGGTVIGRGVFAAVNAAAASGALSIIEIGSTPVGTYLDFTASNGEKWRIIFGTSAKGITASPDIGVIFGFAFLTAPIILATNGDAAAVPDIWISTYAVSALDFGITARNVAGAFLGAYRVYWIAIGRVS